MTSVKRIERQGKQKEIKHTPTAKRLLFLIKKPAPLQSRKRPLSFKKSFLYRTSSWNEINSQLRVFYILIIKNTRHTKCDVCGSENFLDQSNHSVDNLVSLAPVCTICTVCLPIIAKEMYNQQRRNNCFALTIIWQYH